MDINGHKWTLCLAVVVILQCQSKWLIKQKIKLHALIQRFTLKTYCCKKQQKQ